MRKMTISYGALSTLLRENIVVGSVDEKTLKAFIFHLIDLKILTESQPEEYLLNEDELEEGNKDIVISKKILECSATNDGFALFYFLNHKLRTDLDDSELSKKLKHIDKESVSQSPDQFNPTTSRTSNLSNLQIVNKLSKQMSSFMDLEKTIKPMLVGKKVGQKEAHFLFVHIMSELQVKGSSRAWEQLSRRRHK